MKKVVGLNCFWFSIIFFALIPQAFSQTPDIEALKKTAPKVYIDCSSCDIDYIKTEITFVNYVRDRNEAEVHVLITTQGTGSGGREYTLTFSGQNAFKGVDDIEKYFSDSTNTADEVRQGLVKALKMGLMGYVARRPIASQIAVSYTEPKKPETRVDKWKSWVFSLSGQGFFSGEQSYNRNYLDFNVSANRVTPDVKLRLGLSADFGKQHYEYEDQTYSNIQESYYFSGLFVKAFGEHWSAGFSLDAESSTYENVEWGVTPAPALEYDLFPYSQSTRRQLRFLYKLRFKSVRYREETIYDKTSETLWGESLSATLDVKEKWGSITTTLSGSNYFPNVRKFRMDLFGTVQFNLFKGFSAYVAGGGSHVHDQLSLRKREATTEEILLRSREFPSHYDYFVAVGISFTFGSIYTNVVNPRFGRIGGGGVRIVMN